MPEEPNQPNYPYVYFASHFYSADVLMSKNVTETQSNEPMWKIMIRPHSSLTHHCANSIEKIPIDDKQKRFGDYLIVKYPMRLRKTIDSDPTHTVYFLKCDFEGNEVNNIGLKDEDFSEQLKNTQKRILHLKMELAQKDKIMADFIQKRDVIEDIKRAIRESVSQEMRIYQMKKEDK